MEHFSEQDFELIFKFELDSGRLFDPAGPLPCECEYCGELYQYIMDHNCHGIQSASREAAATHDWDFHRA
jgi:hypothetical protein